MAPLFSATILSGIPFLRSDSMSSWEFLGEFVLSLDTGRQLQMIKFFRNFASSGGGVAIVVHDLNLKAMCAASVILFPAGNIKSGSLTAVLRSIVPLKRVSIFSFIDHAPQGKILNIWG